MYGYSGITESGWLVGFIIALCLAILPAKIAQSKGKDFKIWYIYGVLLWIVAIFHAISLPAMSSAAEPEKEKERAPEKLSSIKPNIQRG